MLYNLQSWEDTCLLRSIVDMHEVEHYHMVIAGELHKVAKSRNAQKCIYALVQVDNRVNRMPDLDTTIMREYETYIF